MVDVMLSCLEQAALVENFYSNYLDTGNSMEIKDIAEAEHGFVSVCGKPKLRNSNAETCPAHG